MEAVVPLKSAVTVRHANRADVFVLYEMLLASAVAQGGESELCVNPKNLLEDGFGEDWSRFQCLLAEVDGRIAGIALYFFIYSTWTSRCILYLEDLFVKPLARRHGVARALMAKLAAIAVEGGCKEARWLVLTDNLPARRFYEAIGAEGTDQCIPMFLQHEGLKELLKG